MIDIARIGRTRYAAACAAGLVFAAGVVTGAVVHRSGAFKAPRVSSYQAERTAQLRRFPVLGRIAMAGDSLIEQGEWRGILGRSDVVNVGVSSDQTGHVLQRIDTIRSTQAEMVVLLVGINDLYNGRSPEQVASGIAAILSALSDKRVLLVPILNGSQRLESSVARTNALLQGVCTNHCGLVAPAGLSGLLQPSIAYDGVHLTASGYAELGKALAPLLQR